MRGYTLLELLVVLSLIGLLAALAFPRLQTLYDSFQFSLQKQDIYNNISALGAKAYQQGRGFQLIELPIKPPQEYSQELLQQLSQQQTDIPLELPDGWSLLAKQPIQYSHNGYCSGGEITLYYEDLDINLQLVPPFCIPIEETP